MNTIKAKDQFDELRARCLAYLTGGTDYDPSNKNVALALSGISREAQEYWDKIEKEPKEYLFSDMKNKRHFSETHICFQRLSVMGLAYWQYGCALYQNAELREDVLKGLAWMNENKFAPGIDPDEDWWAKEIASGLMLGYCLVYMYDFMTPAQIDKWIKTIEYYNPKGYDFTSDGWGPTTGANRADKCAVMMFAGIIAKDGKRIEYAQKGMDTVFAYANGKQNLPGTKWDGYMEDGFHPDGSFLQHAGFSYTTGYGTALIEDMPLILYVLNGSKYAISEPNLDRLASFIYDAYLPVVFKGGAFDLAKGREIARSALQSHMMGHRIASALCGLADSMPEAHAKQIKEIAKGWIGSDAYLDFFSYPHSENQRLSVAVSIRMDRLMKDDSITPIVDYTFAKMFAVMERAVMFRPGFAYGVAMHSSRIRSYECLRGENCKGYYTAYGMTYFYTDDDLGQYDGDFWATIDHHRLPGTTVDTIKRADGEGTSDHWRSTSGEDWVGGVALLDTYALCGMSLHAFNVTMKAKKSWFMFGKKIVALGADINSSDNRKIETIIENRKLNANGDITLVINGCAKSLELNKPETVEGAEWIYLGQTGGYYFPKKPAIEVLYEKRSGEWSALGGSGGRSGTNYFASFAFDHGKNPENAEYSYVFLPNMTEAEVKSFAGNPGITILENSEKAQAVRDNDTNITGVNFFTDGGHTVDGISSNKCASILLQTDKNKLSVAVSDPTWLNNETIHVEISKACTGVIEKDAEINVLQTAPSLVFTVSVKNANGKTFAAKFDFV